MAEVETLHQREIDQVTSQITNTSYTPTQASYNFSFLPFLRANNLCALAPEVPICSDYANNAQCPLGRRCTKRHPTPAQSGNDERGRHYYSRPNDNYVCKHWLKGLCKKGDDCDFLHEYNLRKMSECQFYNQNGYCQNGDECLYVHIKEDQKRPKCDDYDVGFCAKGPRCEKRHVRKKLCEFYLAGFCPEGPTCTKGVHLRTSGMKDLRKRRADDLEKKDDENRNNRFNKDRKGGGRWRDRKRKNN